MADDLLGQDPRVRFFAHAERALQPLAMRSLSTKPIADTISSRNAMSAAWRAQQNEART